MIAIDYEPQHDGKDQFESVKQELLEQRDLHRLKFRKALFGVLSAQTVEDARRLVEQTIG